MFRQWPTMHDPSCLKASWKLFYWFGNNHYFHSGKTHLLKPDAGFFPASVSASGCIAAAGV